MSDELMIFIIGGVVGYFAAIKIIGYINLKKEKEE